MPFGFFVEVNPTDPGFGNGGGGDDIDNSLPGGPVHIGGGPIPPPALWPHPPGPPRPWPPLPPPVGTWPPRPFPPTPVDPDWGVGGGGGGNFPIYIPPDRVDNSLPPVAETKPPAGLPPGTVWPPINGAPDGKYILIAGIPGIGWRYVVLGTEVGTPLPPTPEPK